MSEALRRFRVSEQLTWMEGLAADHAAKLKADGDEPGDGTAMLAGIVASLRENTELTSRLEQATGHAKTLAEENQTLRRQLERTRTVPNGWKLVPEAPTPGMFDGFASLNCSYDPDTEHIRFDGDYGNFVACYWKMLERAPSPDDGPRVT